MGRYIVLETLGQGGMGVVYKAYDPELDRQIALKLIKADGCGGEEETAAASRLLREAQALARLSHPNVVQVYDVGTLGCEVFVAMELVAGVTLRQWLDQGNHSFAETLAILLSAGEGLSAAHRSGIVHRDFKPENVIIGSDGRIRVLDFGLARAVGAHGLERVDAGLAGLAKEESGLLNQRLTRAGILGSPGYVAPEVVRGALPTPSMDQFSYAMTLFEALSGHLPFDSGAQLKPSVLLAIPEDEKVPGWILAILRRALASEPADRFPSVEAMLARLQDNPEEARRRAGKLRQKRWAVAALVVVLVGAFGGGALSLRKQRLVCKGAEARLTGVWDPGIRRGVRAAFLAQRVPYAEEAWQRTEQILDHYTRGWSAMHTEACEATRLRGEQSERLLDLRMACLQRQLTELDALVQLFSRADGEVLEHAVQAATSLASVSRCADLEALTARKTRSSDPAMRQKEDDIRVSLARVQALSLTGKYDQGLSLAKELLAAEKKSGLSAPVPETLFWLGDLYQEQGLHKEATEHFYQTVWAAESSEDDEWRARAATRLINVVGYWQDRYAEAELWGKQARSILDRLVHPPLDLELDWDKQMGSLRYARGDFRGAREHWLRGYDRAVKGLSEQHPLAEALRNNLAIARTDLGEYERAHEDLKRTLEIAEKVYGPGHPRIAATLGNLARLWLAQGKHQEALRTYQQQLLLMERTFGKDSPKVANTLHNMGALYISMKQLDQAFGLYQRALSINQRHFGPAHASVIHNLENLGYVCRSQGRIGEALSFYERALKLRNEVFGARDPDTVPVLAILSALYERRGENAKAAALRREMTERQKNQT